MTKEDQKAWLGFNLQETLIKTSTILITLFITSFVNITTVSACGESYPPEWYSYTLHLQSENSKGITIENIDPATGSVRFHNSNDTPLYIGKNIREGEDSKRLPIMKNLLNIDWNGIQLPDDFSPKIMLKDDMIYVLSGLEYTGENYGIWTEVENIDDFEVSLQRLLYYDGRGTSYYDYPELKYYGRTGTERSVDLPDSEGFALRAFWGDEEVMLNIDIEYGLNPYYEDELEEFFNNPNNCGAWNEKWVKDSLTTEIGGYYFYTYELILLPSIIILTTSIIIIFVRKRRNVKANS